MASPTTERSLSATSHENTPEEKEVEMAAEKSAEKVAEKVAEKTETLEKGPSIEKRPQTRSASKTGGRAPPSKTRKDDSHTSLAVAVSLVKFIKVSPLSTVPKPADVDVSSCPEKTTATATEPKVVTVTSQTTAPKETGPKKVSITEEMQVFGNDGVKETSSKAGHEVRPNWTATNCEMAKDLIHHKAAIVRDALLSKAEQRTHNRSSLIEQLAQLPFHTILVKWKMSFTFPVYTPRIVYGILSRFGRIDSMGVLSGNSAFIVFYREYHACRAIMSQQVGFNYCPLILQWWFIQRYKYPLTDAEDVKREDLLLSDGRLERNSKRHIAQIKREFWRKAAALSYDVSTFRP